MKVCPYGFRPCTRCHSGKTNGHGTDYARLREFRPPRAVNAFASYLIQVREAERLARELWDRSVSTCASCGSTDVEAEELAPGVVRVVCPCGSVAVVAR